MTKRISKYMKLSTMGVLAAVALPVSSAHAQISLTKIPKTYVQEGTTFNNLEGFFAVLTDWQAETVDFSVPNLEAFTVNCDAIHPSMTQRTTCQNGQTFTCASLYANSPYKPPRYGQLAPAKSVQNYASYYSAISNRKVLAINLGFFDTRPFPGRNTSQSSWKPIYEEACGLNLGTYRTDSTSQFLGGYNNRQPKADGTDDKAFGTLLMKPAGGTARSLSGNIDADFVLGDLGINGVWLRYTGTTYGSTAAHVPDFVEEKWASKVGRTAIGFNTTSKRMKILVVQGGPGTNTGVSVEDVKKFFPANLYNNLLLLDGSGSSQLAADFSYTTVTGAATTAGRTACLFTAVKTCSKQGDSVDNAFVDHWDASRKINDPANPTTKKLVDRPTPNVLIVLAN